MPNPKKKPTTTKKTKSKPLKSTPQKTHNIKILAFGDSPAVPSGFGTVMRHLFYHLARSGRYDIDVVGINDRGNYKDPAKYPYRIHQARPPGEADPFGRGRFIDIVRGGGTDLTPPWDIIFMLNDPFVLEEPIPYFQLGVIPAIKDIQKTYYTKLPPDMWFKSVAYFPIDSPVKPVWVRNAISLVDAPIAYAAYGADQITLANDQLDQPQDITLHTIPHGVDIINFTPLEKKTVIRFRQDYFAGRLRPDTFLVIAVGRNSHRKDLVRTMQVFREFHKRRPDSFLYIHAQKQGAWGSLEEAGLQMGLRQGKDWNFPQDFIEHKGFPDQILNAIYNAADVLVSTTQGEGWGLPLTEAMAAGTLVMAPNITTIPELMNTTDIDDIEDINAIMKHNIRGIPLVAGKNRSEWINHGKEDLERFRPLTNVEDAVDKLLWVYDHPQEVKTITKRAHKWVQSLSWDRVTGEWEKLLNRTYKELDKDRQNPDQARRRWQSYRLPESALPKQTSNW